MRKKVKINLAFVFFVLASLTEIYAVFFENIALEKIVKPFIIISLFFLYIFKAEKINPFYLMALFFLFFGDFILLYDDLFLTGVTCFLVAYLIYTKITLDFLKKVSLPKLLLPLFFFLAFLMVVIWFIKANIGNFYVLFILYGLVICVFTTLAYFNNLEKPNRTNLLFFLGAFLIAVTNIFISLNRFGGHIILNKAVTMLLYILSQYLICIAMIKKPLINSNMNKQTIFTGLFILSAIIGLLGISYENFQVLFVITPVIFLLLIIIYVGIVKKINYLFLTYLFLVAIGEVLMLFDKKYFLYAINTSVLSQCILIYFIFTYKHIRLKSVLVYFTITEFCYILLGNQVLSIEKHYMIIIYGIVNAFLTALSLDNYIKKMYMANYLLWLGVSFGVLNNAIISLDVFGYSLNIYAFMTNVISHYLICKSFVLRTNRAYVKNIIQ